MTTVLDLLKEEGIQEGLQKGLQEAQDKDITRLLQHTSLSPQEIASILEVGQAGGELRGELKRLGKAHRKCPRGSAVVEDHRDDRTRFSSLPQIPREKG